MARFLVESYLPSGNRCRAAAARLERVELLRTVYVPEDEVCFYLFESDSAELVAEVSRSAALELDRVQPVVALDEP